MLHKITVRKIYTLKGAKLDDTYFIYIGRKNKSLKESPLHNGFEKKIYGLKRCLELYRMWLWEAIRARDKEFRELLRLLQLARQHDINLVCFCIDSEDNDDEVICHGQIIRKALLYLDQLY